MKIGLVHHRWSRRGGAERFLYHLAIEMEQRAHSVEMYAYRFDEPRPANIVFHHLKSPSYPLWLRYLWLAKLSQHKMSISDVDVSLSLGKIWGTSVIRLAGGCHRAYVQRMASLKNASTVSKVVRKLSLYQQIQLLIEDYNFKKPKACCIVAVSNMVKREFCHFYPASASRVVVIHNGRNPEPPERVQSRREQRKRLCQKFGFNSRTKLLLMVATNPWLKGFIPLVEAVNMLNRGHKALHLVLVGCDQRKVQQSLLKRGRTRLNLEHVTFIPFTKELSQWYLGTDLLVHPSFYDAFANVCLEANAHSQPVFTSTSNGGSEIYTDGETALLTDHPDNAERLAQHLQRANDEALLEHIGRKGYDLLHEHTATQMYDAYEALFRRTFTEQSQTL